MSDTAGLAIDPFGTFYVLTFLPNGDVLHTLDPNSGLLTAIGPTGVPGGLESLTFIPEPGTLLLVAAGAIVAKRWRRDTKS